MMQIRKYLTLVEFFKKNYNARITEIEGKIPTITGLATTAAFTAGS